MLKLFLFIHLEGSSSLLFNLVIYYYLWLLRKELDYRFHQIIFDLLKMVFLLIFCPSYQFFHYKPRFPPLSIWQVPRQPFQKHHFLIKSLWIVRQLLSSWKLLFLHFLNHHPNHPLHQFIIHTKVAFSQFFSLIYHFFIQWLLLQQIFLVCFVKQF